MLKSTIVVPFQNYSTARKVTDYFNEKVAREVFGESAIVRFHDGTYYMVVSTDAPAPTVQKLEELQVM